MKATDTNVRAPRFSIIVVALNPGAKIIDTVGSVLRQSYDNFEIVVKDGGSKDGFLQKLPEDSRIRIYNEPDKGIYEAMNQAVARSEGDYILFLNCGDVFYDTKVLERTAECIARHEGNQPLVVYGDTFGAKNQVMIPAPRKIDGFACYRNIPCHQSCFYAAELCRDKPYDLQYRIRADYDHFLWCFYRARARMVYLGTPIASYEGGGFSESRENIARDKQEHKAITQTYMEPSELSAYRRAMLFSLQPLRSFLAENKRTAFLYHWIKDAFVCHKKRMLFGFLLGFLELVLFLASGVMQEEVTHYHSGEGSFGLNEPSFTQSFIPSHKELKTYSFLVELPEEEWDGTVRCTIQDQEENILYEQCFSGAELKDGAYTDVPVQLSLKTGRTYYVTLQASPAADGSYPAVGVVSVEQKLPEQGVLTGGNIPEGTTPEEIQFVSRYCYTGVVPSKTIWKLVLLCGLTAFLVMFGLPDKRSFRRKTGLLLMFLMPLVLGSLLEGVDQNSTIYLPNALKWNLCLMYGIELLVLILSHSPGGAAALGAGALTMLYSANHFVLEFRGTSLRVNDFSAIGTAARVAGGYNYMPTGKLAVAWAVCLVFILAGICALRGKRTETGLKLKKHRRYHLFCSYLLSTVSAVILAGCGAYLCFSTDFFEDRGFIYEGYAGINQDAIYQANGYLVATCMEIRNYKVKAPAGYSKEKVEEILQQASAGSGTLTEPEREALPHIILVMNESLADLRVLADLDLNEENMEFMKSLQENTVRGYVNASVLGGGTANSEFEVLTGCTTAFFSTNFYPYQQAVTKPVDSLVSCAKNYGYTAISMHPEAATNWNRNNVYRFFGFDESLWKTDFEQAEVIHKGVSDLETYRRIIDLYENREAGEKLFVFDVTMQNHGGYPGKNAPYEVREQFCESDSLDEYLSLVKISDQALAYLIGYFEKQEEPVIVCVFGDHQPIVSNIVVEKYHTGADTVPEERMKLFKTPFYIWANYDIEEAEGYDISMNYLGGLLFRTAGIPLPSNMAYLELLQQDYPIITMNGYEDADENYFDWNGNDPFEIYRQIQYYQLFE